MVLRNVSRFFQTNILKTMQRESGTLKFRGRIFPVTIFKITARTYQKLGLNPKIFRPGVKLYIMDKKTFNAFCKTTQKVAQPTAISSTNNNNMIEIQARSGRASEAIDAKITGALYPLSRNGDLDKVRKAKRVILHLSNSSRTVVLKEGFTKLELKHELLHDIFLGSLFSFEMRRGFIRLIVALVKNAYATNNLELIKFFEGVNNKCKNPYRIEDLRDLNACPIAENAEIGPNLFIFAGECFAYALELMLGHKNTSLGKIPEDLRFFLRGFSIE